LQPASDANCGILPFLSSPSSFSTVFTAMMDTYLFASHSATAASPLRWTRSTGLCAARHLLELHAESSKAPGP
jgi:hypothetical protein